MADFWTAEAAVLDEIAGLIVQIDPAYKGKTPFQRYKRGKADFEDAFIGDRQFKIMVPGRWIREHQVGYGYTFPLIEYDIVIQYPTGEEWDRAIHSDTVKIWRSLLNSATAVTGVQLRLIKPQEIITPIKAESDNYQTSTLTLEVHYEVTG